MVRGATGLLSVTGFVGLRTGSGVGRFLKKGAESLR